MAGSYATFRDQMPPHKSRKTRDAVNDGLLQGQNTSIFANPSQWQIIEAERGDRGGILKYHGHRIFEGGELTDSLSLFL